MANITVTHTFVNGTTADATEVNTNFTDIINGTSDGTKDFSISALTVAGTANFSGAVNLNGNTTVGNATTDTITFTGRVASDIDPDTTASYSFGSTSLTYKDLYLDNGATDGGAIYFNAVNTSFIKSDAAGTDLDISGFTNLDINSLNITQAGSITATGTLTNTGALTNAGGIAWFSRADATPTMTTTANTVFDDLLVGSDGTVNVGMTIACTGQGGIAFADAGDNTAGQIRYQHATKDMEFYTATGDFYWSTDNGVTDHMTLQNGGKVGIGTSSPTANLDVRAVADDYMQFSNSTDALANGELNYLTISSLVKSAVSRQANIGVTTNSGCTNGAGYVYIGGDITPSNHYYWTASSKLYFGSFANIGTTTGTVVGDQTSDVRLKKDIEECPYGLEQITKLDAIRFKYNLECSDGCPNLGFSAQQVQELIPESVYNSGPKGDLKDALAMDYDQIIPVLTRAIQQLSEKIDAIELKLAG